MIKTVVRPATYADALPIVDIIIASRAAMPYAPLAHSETELHEWVTEVLIPSHGLIVAEHIGAVVGFAAVSHDGNFTWIDQMYLFPSHTGQGIGSKLLLEIIRTAHGPIRLFTFQENTQARRFYERHGFQPLLFSDGLGNEERCPDVLYELPR
jgi:GNAT superfamily N-acetyltransferase